MSCVVPSEKFPVAVSCCDVPSGICIFAGVIEIDVSVAFVTVSVALAENPPDAAIIPDVPGALPSASPATPFQFIPATPGLVAVHCTDEVMFCVLPSL